MRHVQRSLIAVVCMQLLTFTLGPTHIRSITHGVDREYLRERHRPMGARITLTGRLIVNGASSAASRRLRIQQRVLGTKTWRRLVWVITDRSGRYKIPIELTQPAELEVVYSGDKRRAPATSRVVQVVQRPEIIAGFQFPHPGQLNDIGTLRGSVEPNMFGRQLLVQRKDRGLWRSVDKVDIDRDGTFSTLVVPGQVGRSVYRVKLPPSGRIWRSPNYFRIIERIW
jgi:hypothetical protein